LYNYSIAFGYFQSSLTTVRYAKTNEIVSRTPLVITSVRSSIRWNICI